VLYRLSLVSHNSVHHITTQPTSNMQCSLTVVKNITDRKMLWFTVTAINYLCEHTDMYQNIKDTEWMDLISCLKLCNELFKIEAYCMLTDSSLPVAYLFLHDSGPFALCPFFVHQYCVWMFV
jgi:hypothetical protein